MEFSLPGLIGAAVGLGIGLLNYGSVTTIAVRALRATDRSATEAEKADFERKIRILQILTFVFAVTAFPIAGWLFGATLGGG